MIMVHCRIKMDKFWVKNWKFCTSDPKNYAISEIYANSKIHQDELRSRGAISAALWFGQLAFGLLAHCRVGGAFHSLSFNVL